MKRIGWAVVAALLLALPALAQAPKNEKPGPFMTKALAGKTLWATLDTGAGPIVIELLSKKTPHTVANFVGLVTGEKAWLDPVTGTWVHKPLYDHTIFHRTMIHFMIQGGDPIGTGFGSPGFTLEDEFHGAKFDRTGLVAMANTGQPNSGGSQFFITVSKPRYLDGHYSIFGKVVSGYDVAVRISERPVRGDRPIEPVSLDKVTITDHKPKPKKASGTKAHAK
jgi:peptidyl-prolyl cis-trans isomerase A (cyclophilin A)